MAKRKLRGRYFHGIGFRRMGDDECWAEPDPDHGGVALGVNSRSWGEGTMCLSLHQTREFADYLHALCAQQEQQHGG